MDVGDGYEFAVKWGSTGSDAGQFNTPAAIAVDAAGNVYVAENNHRVQKFDSNGGFVTAWGTHGSGEGQFEFPSGIATDANGNVFVADSGTNLSWNNHRIQKFDADGGFLAAWGEEGSGTGEFRNPNGIAIDADGCVYVADKFNHRVQKFDPEGSFLATFGKGPGGGPGVLNPPGRREGQFEYPTDVATDGDGNVYVVDSSNHRIQRFDPAGEFSLMWGIGVDDGSSEMQVCTSNCHAGASDPSLSVDQSFAPIAIAADGAGGIFVLDYHRVTRFRATGEYELRWGEPGDGDGQFVSPSGIATDASGCVFVADAANNRVQKFSPLG